LTRVVFTHAVSDVPAWASHKAERAGRPSRSPVDYLPTAGGSTVAVSANVHDMDGMLAALQTPDAVALEEAHGVIQPISSFVEGQ